VDRLKLIEQAKQNAKKTSDAAIQAAVEAKDAQEKAKDAYEEDVKAEERVQDALAKARLSSLKTVKEIEKLLIGKEDYESAKNEFNNIIASREEKQRLLDVELKIAAEKNDELVSEHNKCVQKSTLITYATRELERKIGATRKIRQNDLIWVEAADIGTMIREIEFTEGRHILVLCPDDPLQSGLHASRLLWARHLEGFRIKKWKSQQKDLLSSKAHLIRLWADIDNEDKDMLKHIAADSFGVPHPEVYDTMEKLARRGLLSTQTLTFAQLELRKFVRSQITTADFLAWKSESNYSTWDAIKTPLTTAVVMLCAALGISVLEPETASEAITPTLAAGLPAMLKALIGNLNGRT
jgi:hypothetical protein